MYIEYVVITIDDYLWFILYIKHKTNIIFKINSNGI